MLGRNDDSGVIYKPSASGKGDGSIEMSTPTKIIPTLAQVGVSIPSAPPLQPLALNGGNTRGEGDDRDRDDDEQDQDDEREREGDGDQDYIPMIIGPDGRPMSQPPSYDEVLMEDTRYRGGRGGGGFRRLDNEMYEDDLIREDGKL